MQTLLHFLACRSGYVKPREGLAMGWVVVVLVGLIMILGSAERAEASAQYCCDQGYGTFWCCTPEECQSGSPGSTYRYHVTSWANGCTELDKTCSCF